MKYQVGTKVRPKLHAIREIDQIKITATHIEYHMKDDEDWLWTSEEEVTAWYDVVEEGESPND